MAGNIAGAITANAEVAAILEAQVDFTAGNIPVTVEAVDFADGDDGISVSGGDAYEIAYSVVIDNINSQLNP